MPRQTTQKLITALYPRLSHEDTLQGESNSISNQENICQGGFHLKDEILRQIGIYCTVKRLFETNKKVSPIKTSVMTADMVELTLITGNCSYLSI